MCWPVGRVLSSRASRRLRWATIHLGPPLPAASCDPPASSGGPPSDASGEALRSRRRPYLGGPAHGRPLDLAPSGVYRAVPVTRDAGGLLHHPFTLTGT